MTWKKPPREVLSLLLSALHRFLMVPTDAIPGSFDVEATDAS